MPNDVNQGLARPYAPPANVIAVLQRVRRMNMPAKIGREFLLGAGITDNIVPRVSSALVFLGLVDTDYAPTDKLRALASCTEDEYKQLLEQTIRTAYASDFQNINPSVDAQQTIIDTFQRYTPKSQHTRQVMLFLGLCREAGIEVVDSPRERRMQQGGKVNRTRKQPHTPVASDIGSTRRQAGGVTSPEIGGLLFGVTEDDIAALPADEFNEVWAALGKVALARATSKRMTSQAADAWGDTPTESEG